MTPNDSTPWWSLAALILIGVCGFSPAVRKRRVADFTYALLALSFIATAIGTSDHIVLSYIGAALCVPAVILVGRANWKYFRYDRGRLDEEIDEKYRIIRERRKEE